MAFQGHSKSIILGSLESRQGTSGYRVIMLASTLKVLKICRRKLQKKIVGS